MSNLTINNHSLKADGFVIPTQTRHWLIPYNCELLKLLVKQQNLSANDLKFSSKQQCQSFIKQLFLFALEDTANTQMPSDLATLARDLVNINAQQLNHENTLHHET